MDAAGLGVVVTGAAGGIGRAIATRLASEGARVVINDLDSDAVRSTAEEIGAYAVPGDAAGEAGVSALIEQAREHLGSIDIYCANAGVAPEGGTETPEHVWSQSFEINTMAHVRASRILVSEWLERGSGRFIATVSAAGMLMMLGSAPYTVTKHAALSYAEWLSATYRHRGIIVQCICPQGVRTAMLDKTGTAGEVTLRAGAIEPTQVAEALWEGMQDDRFLILPHPEVHDYAVAKATDPDRWLGGMNKLQRRIDG